MRNQSKNKTNNKQASSDETQRAKNLASGVCPKSVGYVRPGEIQQLPG